MESYNARALSLAAEIEKILAQEKCSKIRVLSLLHSLFSYAVKDTTMINPIVEMVLKMKEQKDEECCSN